ncbi:MAG: hypothetical protein ACP5TK_00380 [Candidatus Micrarchaeia archaeon]
MPEKIGIASVMGDIFKSPYYVVLAVIVAFIYYYLIIYLVQVDNSGAFLITIPSYLIYALVFASSILLTVSVYSIRKAFNATKSGLGGGVLSAISTFFSALIFSCGCTAPLLNIVLGLFALNIGTIVSLRNFLASYQALIVSAIIVIDVVFIFYQLSKLTKTCALDKGKIVSLKVKLK